MVVITVTILIIVIILAVIIVVIVVLTIITLTTKVEDIGIYIGNLQGQRRKRTELCRHV
jgi:hypothetical protein